jgi:hypothetical protein
MRESTLDDIRRLAEDIAVARRKAAAAQAELAAACVAYADARIADRTRRLVARSRRLALDIPTAWQAFHAGEVDAEQVRVIDRVARRVTEPHTLAAIDDQVVEKRRVASKLDTYNATWCKVTSPAGGRLSSGVGCPYEDCG